MHYFVFNFDSNELNVVSCLFISKDISEVREWIYKNQEKVINKNVHVVDDNFEFVDIW